MGAVNLYKIKPCRNCGETHPHAEGLRPGDMVICDCGEEMTMEKWQADNGREKHLQAQLDALIALHKHSEMCRHLVTQSLIGVSEALEREGLEFGGADDILDKATQLMEEIPYLRDNCQKLGLEV